MTGPEGKSSFCFPRISMFPRGAAEENIEIRGKQNELFFPERPVIKWFDIWHKRKNVQWQQQRRSSVNIRG